jgi:hypothetical protein
MRAYCLEENIDPQIPIYTIVLREHLHIKS